MSINIYHVFNPLCLDRKLAQCFTLSPGDNSVKDTHSSAESSDSEDEEYIEGHDDKESEEEELEELRSTAATQPTTGNAPLVENGSAHHAIPEEPQQVPASPRKHSAPPKSASLDQILESKKMTSSNSFDSLSDANENKVSASGREEARPRMKKQSAFNFDLGARKTSKDNRKFSTESDPGVSTEYQRSQHSRLQRQGAFKASRGGRGNASSNSSQPQSPGQDKWANRRFVWSDTITIITTITIPSPLHCRHNTTLGSLYILELCSNETSHIEYSLLMNLFLH